MPKWRTHLRQEASISHLVAVSKGLLEHPHDMKNWLLPEQVILEGE